MDNFWPSKPNQFQSTKSKGSVNHIWLKILVFKVEYFTKLIKNNDLELLKIIKH